MRADKVRRGKVAPSGRALGTMEHSGISPPTGDSSMNSRSRSTPDPQDTSDPRVHAAQAIAHVRTRSSPARSSSTERGAQEARAHASHVPRLQMLGPRAPRDTMSLGQESEQRRGWTQGRPHPTIPEATFIAGAAVQQAHMPPAWRPRPHLRQSFTRHRRMRLGGLLMHCNHDP